jgi:hypothetical protein
MEFGMSPEYLAGVWDSDGSFSIAKRHKKRETPNYTAMLQLSWTRSAKSLQVMRDLCAAYGGSFMEISRSSMNGTFPNARPVVKYCATGRAAYALAAALKPFLRLKEQQARNVLKLQHLVRWCGQGRRRPQAVSRALEQIYVSNKLINSKNSGSRSKLREAA